MKTPLGKLKVAFVLLFLAVWVFGYSYRFFSPAAERGRAFLEHIPADSIQYVRLNPTRDNSLISKTVIVRDRQKIQAIVSALTGMTHYLPEHPNTKWSVTITIVTSAKQYGGMISGTSNQGVLFDFYSSISKGWLYQTYRLRKPPADVSTILAQVAGA